MELTPVQYATLKILLSNREWRLNHLYHVVNKDGKIVRFSLNWAQRQIHSGLHHYNNILKARQLGISTYTALLILDMCMFTPNYTAGIVDRTGPESKRNLPKSNLPSTTLTIFLNPLRRKTWNWPPLARGSRKK